MDLFNMAERVFKRVFKEDPDYFIFMKEFMEFLNGTGRFLDEMMRLESLKANYEKGVSPYHNPSLIAFTDLKTAQNWPLDLVAIWGLMADNSNSIARLAVCIYSIIANSGATEHNFSDFGNIQTKKRS